MSLAPILQQYLANHPGWHFTAKETAISSPLQFLLAHAAEQQKISQRTNYEQIQLAVNEELG